jgi:hypothetical protein
MDQCPEAGERSDYRFRSGTFHWREDFVQAIVDEPTAVPVKLPNLALVVRDFIFGGCRLQEAGAAADPMSGPRFDLHLIVNGLGAAEVGRRQPSVQTTPFQLPGRAPSVNDFSVYLRPVEVFEQDREHQLVASDGLDGVRVPGSCPVLIEEG